MDELNASGQNDIQLSLQDFVSEIRRLDDLTFVARGHAPASIFSFADYPEGGMPGIRVNIIASLLGKVPTESTSATNVVTFPKNHECYALWLSGVARKLHSPQFYGFGDVLVRQFFFLSAVGLVRSRVLTRRRWFPESGIRTLKSMRRKHASVFGDNAFMELRTLSEMFEGKGLSVFELDVQLTEVFAAAALQNKVISGYPELVQLIISD